MKIRMSPVVTATSGPGPSKWNLRMMSVLSLLSSGVSGSTYANDELTWPLGSVDTPIAQSERMYAIHRTLISADMDPTASSPNASIPGLFIALNNRHAVTPGWYEYSSSKRSGILCRVYVEDRCIRAVETRHDPYGLQHNFAQARQTIATYMQGHTNKLQANIRRARDEPGITDAATHEMVSRLDEVRAVHALFASEAEVEDLLDQLRALYDFKANPGLESLWNSLTLLMKDTPEDLTDLAAHIVSRQKRMGEPDEKSLRTLLRKLGQDA